MKDYRKNEIGKIRHDQLKMIQVINGTVMGVAALWVIWTSTSILLNLVG